MNESRKGVIKFLEKEIKTYRALSLFLSKKDKAGHARVGARPVLVSPAYYKDRVKEARKLVYELRKT
jgi:hypothetical protein